MLPWRAFSPRSRRSGSMRLGSAPAPRPKQRCSSIARCFTTGSACTQPWATALRLRPGPAWRRSPCALRRDILIYPLHTKGGGPFGNQLRIEAGLAIARDLQIQLAGVSDHRLAAIPVATVARPSFACEMVIHLGIQDALGQRLF